MNNNPIDSKLKFIGKVASTGGWVLSIIFSASGFGLQGSILFVIAGYFLALLVTMFEVILNRYGSQLPRTLAVICFLAYGFGITTNVVGIFYARGAGGTVADYLIAITIGIALEVFPEPLFMFCSGVRSSDLLETLGGLFSRKRRQPPQQPPAYPPVIPGKRGRHERQQYQR